MCSLLSSKYVVWTFIRPFVIGKERALAVLAQAALAVGAEQVAEESRGGAGAPREGVVSAAREAKAQQERIDYFVSKSVQDMMTCR